MRRYEVRQSATHGTGVFATADIRKGARIVEYLGNLIRKAESEKLYRRMMREHRKDRTRPAVMVFNLTRTFDLDGDVPENDARFINHSCEPNCEAIQDGRRIFIHAMRPIKAGEELFFDYGFAWGAHWDHKCLCGSPKCVGYILSQEHHHRLRK